MIHERDVAAVAARVLTADGYPGAKHVLTGPQVLSGAEQVRMIGVVTPTVERITGTAARTFREWATDHAHDFR